MQILTWRKLSGSCRIRDCHTLYTFHIFYTFHNSYTSRKFSVNPAAVFVDCPGCLLLQQLLLHATHAWCMLHPGPNRNTLTWASAWAVNLGLDSSYVARTGKSHCIVGQGAHLAGCGTRLFGVDGRGEVRPTLRRLPHADARRVPQSEAAVQDPVPRRAGGPPRVLGVHPLHAVRRTYGRRRRRLLFWGRQACGWCAPTLARV